MTSTTLPESQTSAPSSQASVATMAGLAGFAAVVRVLTLIGYQGQDDRSYLAFAQYVASGQDLSTLDVANQWVGRIGFWLPISWLIQTFGAGQAAYVAYPLLVSVAGVLVTFALASITVGARAGVLAALLLAVFPLDVLYATRPYPDVPLGVLMVLVLWLALKSRSSLWAAPLAGLVLGLAYLVKETALFAAVPIALLLPFWQRRSWRPLALMAIGAIMVASTELAFWSAVKGDPMYRFNATDSALTSVLPEGTPSTALFGIIPGPRPYDAYRSSNTLLDAALMLVTNEELVLLYWLVVPIIVVGVLTRDRQTSDLRRWILILLPMIVFLPVVPPYYTMPRDPRYLTCLTIPALLILAAYLQRWPSRVRAFAVVLFIGTSAVGILLGKESSRMEPQVTLLDRYPGERLWVSPQYAADLVFLSGIRPQLPIGIQLTQQRRTAGSFESVTLVRPDLPIADDLAGVTDGLLILHDGRRMPDTSGWVLTERLAAHPSWPVQQVQGLLRMAGLDKYAKKLDPGGGAVALVYRRSSRQVQ